MIKKKKRLKYLWVNVVNFLSPSFSAQEIIHKTSINSNHLFDLHQEIWKFLITWQIFCGLHLFTCPNMSCMAANRLLQDWMWKGSYILVWLFLREMGKKHILVVVTPKCKILWALYIFGYIVIIILLHRCFHLKIFMVFLTNAMIIAKKVIPFKSQHSLKRWLSTINM